ncbi:MAG: hypothetical protein ACOYIK_11290 [Coriobacteriales bacterium]
MIEAELQAVRNERSEILKNALLRISDEIENLKRECLQLQEHRSEMLHEIEELERKAVAEITDSDGDKLPSNIELAKLYNQKLREKTQEILDRAIQELEKEEQRVSSTAASEGRSHEAQGLADKLSEGDSREYSFFSTEMVEDLLNSKERDSKSNTTAKGSPVEPRPSEKADKPSPDNLLESAKSYLDEINLLLANEGLGAKRKRVLTELASEILQGADALRQDGRNSVPLQNAVSQASFLIDEAKTHCTSMRSLYYDCQIQAA